MKNEFIERISEVRKDHGWVLCDVTIDKKIFHYIFEGLALYAEKDLTKSQKTDMDNLIKELNELNAHMSGEELA